MDLNKIWQACDTVEELDASLKREDVAAALKEIKDEKVNPNEFPYFSDGHEYHGKAGMIYNNTLQAFRWYKKMLRQGVSIRKLKMDGECTTPKKPTDGECKCEFRGICCYGLEVD